MSAVETIFGRDEELARLRGFVADVSALPRAAVIAGEAGIGKTTLWEWTIDAATAHGYRVLTCAPAASEAALAYAALGDLVQEVVDDVLPELPAPQRRSLAVALLLDDHGPGPPPEPRAIGVAVLGGLRALARGGPVLVAVDDVQWLDPSSSAVLEFAVRRLRMEPVALLLARRSGPGEAPAALERALPARSALPVDVGPLSLGAIQRLVRSRLGVAFPRPTLHRLRDATGGNAFHALEVARALAAGPPLVPGEPLPVPPELAHVVQEHIAALAPATLRAIEAAAALAHPTLRLVEAATGMPAPAVLAPAVETNIVEIHGERVRFAHPLFAAGVVAALADNETRALHARLAIVVGDLEQRARHLALAAAQPDAEVSLTLERAAEAAASRGAPGVAGELAELAARLTPADARELAQTRLLAAAAAHSRAGAATHAAALLARLRDELPAGPGRADVLRRLAWLVDDIDGATRIYEQALAESSGDPAQEAVSHVELALAHLMWGRVSDSVAHARAGYAAAAPRDALEDKAAGIRLLVETFAGEPVSPELIARVRSLAAVDVGTPTFYSPAKMLGLRLMFEGRLDPAREHLERYRTRAIDHGDELLQMASARYLAELEWRAGRWASAAGYAAELAELAEPNGEDERAKALYVQALLAVGHGEVEEARVAAAAAASLAASAHDEFFHASARGLLGFLELSLGRAQEAASILLPLALRLEELGYRDPGLPDVPANAVEAAIATGEFEWAREAVQRLGARACDGATPWARAVAARSRGLLAGAERDFESAFDAFEEALHEQESIQAPLERARTLLALGAAKRRARERRVARETLGEALAGFEALGAVLWAQRAQEELSRVGGRTRGGPELTPTELRVAEFVAGGGTNREAADALFMTVRTVEWNLSKIYAKLGIRSRTELARLFAAGFR